MQTGSSAEDRLQKGVVEIAVVAETARELERVLAERGWERDEGLRRVLAAGLDYILERVSLPSAATDCPSAAELHTQLERMIGSGARLAALLYRMHQWEQACQAHEVTHGAMVKEASAYEQRVWEQIREAEALRGEIARLRAELAARDAAPNSPPPRRGRRSWLRRFGRR